ncbi:hypothetical protein MRX96_056649 [Rhipicephalus microplus]
MGNSGGDIAVELSYVCPQVYMSTRRGDVGGSSSSTRVLNSHFDHKMYGLKPAHHAINQQPFVNDVLPSRILTGTVQIRGNVSRLGPDYAEFRDGSRVVIDDVIVATGYSKHYPFLPPEVAPVAFVGLVEPIGGFWPVAEMQARYVARVLSGKLQLPDVERQRKEAARRASALAIDSARYAAQVHWIAYMDELASILGVKPNLEPLGDHRPGAREAILDFPKRVASVLTPHTAPEETSLRRATAGAIDIAATCTVMILIAYVLSLAI